MVARRLMVCQIFVHFFKDSIELLEIMFDGRAFHFLAVVGKKLFPNVLDECLILTNWMLCLREHRAGYVHY